MKSLYFSGFCLENEKELFSSYIIENDFTVSGFSYGAIKAFKYTLEALKNNQRVDKLQLFSPAYFNTKDKKFKRLQLMFFKKDENEYKNNFIKNTIFPNNHNINQYLTNGTYTQLEELLYFPWDKHDLQTIIDANIKLEIFIGQKDKIVDAISSKEFFRQFGEVYFLKGVGHSLN